ncbi:MAG: cytochrome d ubiquinol oxidase subunit II, partial [Muribaculaceae bacterium]|nr:cytochrome d ubiquinol oxidase subunit II [Muribaculaceae bacterium]
APTHGLEAIFNWKNLILGVAVLLLARMQAALYMMNNISGDNAFFNSMKKKAFVNGCIFVIFFLWFLAMVLTATGYTVISNADYTVEAISTPFKYFHNLLHLWWAAAVLLAGVALVLFGRIKSCFSKHFTKGVWYTGSGTFLAVTALFCIAGFNDTAFYPSLSDPASSLTIRNASSSEFTLVAMSFVSIVIPFVIAYIWYVWHSMDRKKLSGQELETTSHKY